MVVWLSVACAVSSFFVLVSSSVPVGLYETAGDYCESTLDCYSNSTILPNDKLLICKGKICLCDLAVSHYVYEYISRAYQKSIGCQSKKFASPCRGLYRADRKCFCPSNRVASITEGDEEGFCNSEDSYQQTFNSFCSSLKTGCDGEKLLMCNAHRCTCPRNTHLYLPETERCLKVSDEIVPAKYSEPCSELEPCQENLVCSEKVCKCDLSCGPYLETHGMCACEARDAFDYYVKKVIPSILVVLVIVAVIIFVAVKYEASARCCGSNKRTSPHSNSNNRSPSLSTHNNSHYFNISSPTAPPYSPEDDLPPSYDEVMRASRQS